MIQVDTNIVLFFLAFNKEQRQNDTCVDLCHQMESDWSISQGLRLTTPIVDRDLHESIKHRAS